MLILHTADWHLGRSLKGADRLEDQAFALDQIVQVAEDAQPHLIVIAGDVFDRAVPPAAAVELLNDTLARLVLEAGIPVVMIAGNHDDPRRLAYGSRFFAEGGLWVAGLPSAPPLRLAFEDAWGPVELVALPFAEPGRIGERLGLEPPPSSQDDAVAASLATLPEPIEGARRVLVGHVFAAGGQVSGPESERPDTVGSIDAVSTARFAGFHYTALGHLHAAQSLSFGRIRYSGSPLAHSFDEVHHAKSVSLVELDPAGDVSVELVPIAARRSLRVVQGPFEMLLRQPPSQDWILADLDDPVRPLAAFERLREAWPNLLGFAPPRLTTAANAAGPLPAASDPRIEAPEALFASFWEAMERGALGSAQRELLARAIRSAREDKSEGSSGAAA